MRMPGVKYKYAAYISSFLALSLIVFNIYYFFIRRDVGILFYIQKAFYPAREAVLMSPDYKDLVDEYANFNQSANTAVIVFLGDSLTKRFNVQEYFPGYDVLNRGVYSDTTVGLLNRLDRNVNNLKISKLFLLIGYNDLQYRTNKEILANIGLVVDRIHSGKIYVQSLLPVEAKRKDINFRINDINESLKILCESKGIEFIDLHRHFLDDTGGISRKYSLDGIHLNGAGCRLWKELILDKL